MARTSGIFPGNGYSSRIKDSSNPYSDLVSAVIRQALIDLETCHKRKVSNSKLYNRKEHKDLIKFFEGDLFILFSSFLSADIYPEDLRYIIKQRFSNMFEI